MALMGTGSRRRGRVEGGLDRDLRGRADVGAAERAALRAQAHAVDLAEQDRDPDRLSRANAVYLDLRRAAGMTAHAAAQPASDPFDTFLRDLARPEPATRDETD